MTFGSADGLRLEGRYHAGGADRAAVLCHPHPRHGGTMDNAVVRAAEAAFRAHGYTTLAFNFRGAGKSEGAFGGGVDERQDVLGAIAHLAERLGAPPATLALAGYSFGAGVAAHVAAADRRVTLFVGIGPPCALYDFTILKVATCRMAFVVGRRDPLCDLASLEALAATLPGPPAIHVVEADHFFAGREREVGEALTKAIMNAE